MNIVVAIISSGALSALISGIFTLIQNRKGKLARIENDVQHLKQALVTAEKDALRTQLLLMIKSYPHETTDILRLAEHYFKDLRGNWILNNIFVEWASERDIQLPAWFKEEQR